MDKEIENKNEKVNGVYNLTVQLLPALEKTSKSCLTESILNRKKCNVGEVNCTEINLIDNSVNCSVCVDGTLTPVTDDGSLDYCAHFVSLKKARLSITVEDRDKGLKFSTLNGNVTGNIIVKPTHQDEDSNSKVKCSWALYSYSNINGDSQLLNLINKLLHCDTKDKWLCLETESYNNQRTGVCYSFVASCIIQGKNSIPTCSLVKNVEVKVNTPCSSGGHVHQLVDGIDKCNFTWKFNKEDLIYDETKIYFNFNWNNDSEIKIKDFKCFKGNSLVCSNNVSTCSTEYHYDYSNCMFSANPPPPTKAVSNPTTTDMTDTTTLLLIIIIVILGVFFVVYVGHKNYQKVSCLHACISVNSIIIIICSLNILC